jgi:Cyclic nucleotide-binding domain
MPFLLTAAFLSGAGFVVLGIATLLPVALVVGAVAGISRSLLEVSAATLLQRATPTVLLARVFAFKEGLSMAAWGLGSIMVPALIALGGVKLALIGTGAIVPVIVLTRFSRLLHIDAIATVPIVAITLLRSMRIFRALPVPALEGIALGATEVSVAGGASIVKQGEPGDRYYAIADGTVEVTIDGRLVGTLDRGEGFGEIALLHEAPRTASVTAKTDASLLAIEREPFLVALIGHAESEARLTAIVDERLPAGR